MNTMTPLTRYWFTFERSEKPGTINLGCGVSAYDYGDAINILRDYIFGANGPPPILHYIEDVDISTLDANHVLPNLGVPFVRGVWFPRGYERIRH